jgi:uncharacterized surface protein with fasciclin (FAS1) repeats
MIKNTLKLIMAIGLSTGIAVSAFAAAHKNKETPKDIVAVASSAEGFSTLVAAVSAADLVGVLQSEGPFTVFAPNDAAFAKLPAGTLESLLKPENKDQLIAILKYHVVPGKVMAADVKAGDVPTANGQSLTVKTKYGKVYVDNAQVITTDIMASNGVIHVIDSVILPGAATL